MVMTRAEIIQTLEAVERQLANRFTIIRSIIDPDDHTVIAEYRTTFDRDTGANVVKTYRSFQQPKKKA